MHSVQSDQPSVTLKEGIDLNKLSDGITMEIDVEASQHIGCNSDEENFEREDILQHLNLECIDLGGREDTSDSEDGNLVSGLSTHFDSFNLRSLYT